MRALTILPPPPELREPAWHVPDTMPPPAEPDTGPRMASLEEMLRVHACDLRAG